MTQALLDLYVYALLLCPALPAPERPPAGAWDSLRRVSLVLELTAPRVESWGASFRGEIRWHRDALRRSAGMPMLRDHLHRFDPEACRVGLAAADLHLEATRARLRYGLPGECERDVLRQRVCHLEVRRGLWADACRACDPRLSALTRRDSLAAIRDLLSFAEWMEGPASWPVP